MDRKDRIPTRIRVLQALARMPEIGMTTTELVNRLGVDYASVHRALDRLLADRLVEVVTDGQRKYRRTFKES